MTDVNVLVLNNEVDIKTPEDLLTRVLPQIVGAVDGACNARVYRLARGGFVVWHNMDAPETDGTFYGLELDSPSQQAIEQKQVVVDEKSQFTIAPILANGDVFALLMLEFEGIPLVEPVIKFAADLGLVLHSRHLHLLLQRQMSATSSLNKAETLSDVAAIMARTMVEPEQYIGMNMFEYGADNRVSSARMITSANRRDSYVSDMPMPLQKVALQKIHDSLLQNGDMLISDVSTDALFSDEGRKWLLGQKARSVYLIGVSIDGHLSAFMSLIDTKRSLAPSDMEMALFQNIAQQAAAVLEKQQLLEQTQEGAEQSIEQARVMRLLSDLIAEVNTEQDETLIFQRTADVLLAATRADHVGIVLHGDNGAFVVSDAPDLGIVGAEVEAGEGSVGEVLSQQRKALVITDVANDTILPDKSREILKQVGTKSIVLFPMFDLDGRLLGTVGLDYYMQQESIPPVVVDTAQTIVSQVVLNLQKIRLLAQSQQHAKQAQHITDFGQKLRAYLGVRDIVTTALHASQDLLKHNYAAIMLYERESDSLRYVGEAHGDKIQIELRGKFVDGEVDMIATQAWAKREIMIVDDLHTDWEWKHPIEKELQTVIAQPLTSAGVVLGIMEIGHQSPSAYNAVDIATFQQMGNQLAIALSNAEAYSQSQKIARNKSFANDIITKIQQQPDVNSILEVTVQELGQALGAKRGRIRLGTSKSNTSGGTKL